MIGAPNMFNAYGANIDLYYRASFINKWGHESAPSPLPSKGITALDSADDCVQVNFSAPFFRLTDTNIDTIRLYRYGGDSSEFLFLKDIPMPTLPVDSVTGDKYFPTISGINSVTNGFSRKSAISPYYLLKTTKDISSLSGFTNSNFLLTATPSSLDGSWRVNQVSESTRQPAPSSILSGIGASLIQGASTSWTQNSTSVTNNGDYTGTAPAVGQLITHAHFPTGTKIASIGSVDWFETDTVATSSGSPAANGALERGRAFTIAELLTGETIDSVTIGGVATTAYSISGSTITFTAAPAIGTNNISVLTTYSSVLTEDLNTTGTTVKLSNTTSWPASGVVKLGTEYISYAAISSASYDVTSTVPPSISWQDSQSTVSVTAESSSASGSGYTCTITTNTSDNTNLTQVSTNTGSGSGYVFGEKITLRDPGSTNNYAIVTVTQINGSGGVNSINETNYSALGAVTYANSTDLVFTDSDNILQDGYGIQFTTSGTLPGDITANTNYYVNDRTSTTFRVETVVGGGNVQFGGHLYSSTAGSGVTYLISNILTGCVRGIRDTNGSDHKSGHVKAITITAGGTNFGFDNGSGGFTSADKVGESFTNPTNTNRLLNNWYITYCIKYNVICHRLSFRYILCDTN